MNASVVLQENHTCEEARLFGTQDLSDHLERIHGYFVAVLFSLVGLFILFSSSLFVYVVTRVKQLYQFEFFLLAHLVVFAFFGQGIFTTPAVIVSVITGKWSLGYPYCFITGGVFTFIYEAKSWICLISMIDNFCKVFLPLQYRTTVRKKTILSLYLTGAAYCVLGTALPLGFSCMGFDRSVWFCLSAPSVECINYRFCLVINIVLVGLTQTLGGFIPLSMYFVMFIKAKKVRNQLHPEITQEQRERDRQVNITFFIVTLWLFVFSSLSVLTYLIIRVIIPALQVTPPQALVFIAFLFQHLYTLLPIIEFLAILRNHMFWKAVRC